MKKSIRIPVLTLAAILPLIGCVSAAQLLEYAEDAWSRGDYIEAIDQGLSSYERAVDQDKDPGEIEAARSFLEIRFPEANANLSGTAEQRLEGSDSEKADAWKIYSALVSLNRRVRDSAASSFLTAEDFTDDLKRAKEVAAQLRYVKALELMGEDRRESYISAVGAFDEIEALVPGYRDIRTLRRTCIEAGTVTVALSSRKIKTEARKGNITGLDGIGDDVIDALRAYVVSKDYPDFLKFTSAPDAAAAAEAGAVLFVDVGGNLWVSAEREDDYGSNGRIVWQRSYGGDAQVRVTRLDDEFSASATANLGLTQSLEIEFYPVKYKTRSLTPDLYNGQFNNAGWMADQLARAQAALAAGNGRAAMVVWAEMQFGGTPKFLESAEVAAAEGSQILPIDPGVYHGTAALISSTLPQFLGFRDFDLGSRLVREISDAFLSDLGVTELLANL